MINERTGLDIKLSPVLEAPEKYVYILLNTAGKVKVGISHNIQQRIQSLSGSNSQGNKIIKCYHSPATYLYTIEEIMHGRMDRCRLKNTEWFYYEEDPTGEILYYSAIELLEKLFNSNSYERCNELRKKMLENK